MVVSAFFSAASFSASRSLAFFLFLSHFELLTSSSFFLSKQHDRCFMRETPMASLVASMSSDPSIKYAGILMRSNLQYLEIFIGKFGASKVEEYRSLTKRPPSLLLPASSYGSPAVAASLCDRYPRCAEKYALLRKNYVSSTAYGRWFMEEHNSTGVGEAQASLLPTAFWYDNVHVARTEHYRDYIFDPEKKLVAKGGFVEDKLSPAIMASIKAEGLTEGWGKYGCFLLDDHSGVPFTGHLDGGSFMTDEEREKNRPKWDDSNGAKEKEEERRAKEETDRARAERGEEQEEEDGEGGGLFGALEINGDGT